MDRPREDAGTGRAVDVGAEALSAGAASASAAGAAKKRRTDPLGRALRVAYDDMLREDVPKDFLDLLGKLD